MCSLEDAWGKDYQTKFNLQTKSGVFVDNMPVSSQSELHDAYNKTPNNLFEQQYIMSKNTPDIKNPRLSNTGDAIKTRIQPNNAQTNNYGQFNIEPYVNTDKQTSVSWLNSNDMNNQQNEYLSVFKENENMKQYMKQYNTDDNSSCENKVENDKIINCIQKETIDEINKMLELILQRLDKIENRITSNNKKNYHDIILYTVFGILLAFVIYSIINAIIKT